MTNGQLEQPAPGQPSPRKVLVGVAAAVVAVAGVTVAFVLPAEFGIDPTGIGRLTGLLGMAEPADPASTPELERGARRTGVLTLLDHVPPAEAGMQDRWEYELGPYESIEFKYTIPEGQAVAFTWQSDKPLQYDLHAHPFEGGVDLTESYGVGEATVMHGRYVAPFTGLHGWYWQNPSYELVQLSLEATGGFSTSTIFDSTGEHERPLPAPAE